MPLSLKTAVLAALLASGAAHAAPTACDLVTQAQAVQIFGGPLPAGTETNVGSIDTCLFQSDTPDNSVSLTITSFADPSVTTNMIDTMAKGEAGMTVVPVSGLGDKAYYDSSDTESSVWFLYKGKIFALDANNHVNKDVKSALMQVAHGVVSKY